MLQHAQHSWVQPVYKCLLPSSPAVLVQGGKDNNMLDLKTLISKGFSQMPVMTKVVNGGTPLAAPACRWVAGEAVNGCMLTDYLLAPTSAH